jgi:exopolysaccharide biosynthesis protein
MSLKETAEVMLKYGCVQAMNLDGGGSSILAIRDPKSHKMQILNHPSDGRERSVANVLGVSIIPHPHAGAER